MQKTVNDGDWAPIILVVFLDRMTRKSCSEMFIFNFFEEKKTYWYCSVSHNLA